MELRDQTIGEEIANSISHGLGAVLAVAALPILIVESVRHGHTANIFAASVFGGAMVVLYLASALYHGITHRPTKAVLMQFDYAAIYIFIAASYTPFALGVLAGPWGWTIFAAIWTLAILGTTLRLTNRLQNPWWSTSLYLAMGWLVVLVAVPLVRHVAVAGIVWLVLGGLSYTAGVYFFMTDHKVRFRHFIWHLFVMGGSACHFFAVLRYAA